MRDITDLDPDTSFFLYVPASNRIHAENMIRGGHVYRSEDAARAEADKQTREVKYRWTVYRMTIEEILWEK